MRQVNGCHYASGGGFISCGEVQSASGCGTVSGPFFSYAISTYKVAFAYFFCVELSKHRTVEEEVKMQVSAYVGEG